MNKIDRLPPDQRELVEQSWLAQTRYPTVFLSATERIGIEAFYQQLIALLRQVIQTKRSTLLP